MWRLGLDGLDVPDVLGVLSDGAVGRELCHVGHGQNRLLRPRRLVLVQLIRLLNLCRGPMASSPPPSAVDREVGAVVPVLWVAVQV